MHDRSERPVSSLLAAGLLALVLGAPAGAMAHIDIDRAGSHMSRYGGTEIKQGPCGRAGGGRGQNVYTYEPGDTMVVTVTEYVGHPGYFRIAFDDDGDDDFLNPQTVDPINRACLADPSDRCGASDFYNNDAVLMDNLDPHDYPAGTPTYTWEVQLPDVECDNCTLQILQVMTDPAPIHAPYDPSPTSDDLYYQCIDLVLRRGTPAGGVDPDGMMMNPPDAGTTDPDPSTGGTGGMAGGAAGGTAGGGAPQAGPGTVGGGTGGGAPGATPSTTGGAPSGDSGGCAVSRPNSGSQAAGALLLAAAALLLRRRRR